jgi:hypothetical protein
MKHLINREEYIKEYLRVSNIENNNDNMLYESLLSTVFGGLKMLFKKDWENIRCKNPSVLDYLKEIDKSLSGYTMVKMEFSNECNNIRQNIADYYNDILDYKLLQLEKEENAEKFLENEKNETEDIEKNEKDDKRVDAVGKILNIKDKTLLDSLKKYVENIKTNSSKSPKLKEYADQMLNAVIVTVNDIILKELEKKGVDKAKLEEERKKLEEEKKHLEEIRKKMDEVAKKAGEKALNELSKERDDAMKKIGVNPIGAMDGSKAVEMITKQFSDMLKEFNNLKVDKSECKNIYNDVFKSDTYIGIERDIKDLDLKFDGSAHGDVRIRDKFLISVILNKINTVFKVVLENKDKFKGVPSASVQAMMVSLANVIIYGFTQKDEFKNKDEKSRLSLMARCIIDSDATLGFNLPLVKPENPKDGNFFVGVMNQFRNNDISSEEIKDILEKIDNTGSGNTDRRLITNIHGDDGSKLMKNFRQSISNLFKEITDEAKKIKEDSGSTTSTPSTPTAP